MGDLADFLGTLQQILGNMVTSVTDTTVGVNGIACDANAMLLANKDDPTSDVVADLTKTNTTIAKMKQSIYDMKSDVEKYRERAEDPQVKQMISYAIALLVSLPFIIYIIHTCLGVACTACRSVMPAAAREANETSALTYYLECAGENPMAKEA